MPAFVGVLLLTAVVAAMFAGLVAIGMDELRNESHRFRDAVPGAVDRLERSEGIGTVIDDLRLDDSVRSIADQAVRRAQFDGPDLPGLATAIGGRVSAVFVVWILSVMLVFTGPTMVRSLVDQAPTGARDEVDLVLRQAYGRTIRYLALTSLRAVAAASSRSRAATLLGLDMPGLLAIIAALAAFVPYVGHPRRRPAGVADGAAVRGDRRRSRCWRLMLALQVLDAVVVQQRIDRTLGRSSACSPRSWPRWSATACTARGVCWWGWPSSAMLVAVVNDAGAVQALRDAAHGSEPATDRPAGRPPERSAAVRRVLRPGARPRPRSWWVSGR